MSQRSNAIKTSKLSATLDERDAYTGFNSSKNAYVKQQLFKTAGKDLVPESPQPQRNTRQNGIISELQQQQPATMTHSKAHVPKLLLT